LEWKSQAKEAATGEGKSQIPAAATFTEGAAIEKSQPKPDQAAREGYKTPAGLGKDVHQEHTVRFWARYILVGGKHPEKDKAFDHECAVQVEQVKNCLLERITGIRELKVDRDTWPWETDTESGAWKSSYAKIVFSLGTVVTINLEAT
jgi:hypothetical protein